MPRRRGVSKPANSQPSVLPVSGGIALLPTVFVDITSKRHRSPIKKSMRGLPACGGMPSLPHIVTNSRLPDGDMVKQTLPILDMVTKPVTPGEPKRTLPASGGAPSLPVITTTPQSVLASPSWPRRHSGSALQQSPTGIKCSAGSPASGGIAVLPASGGSPALLPASGGAALLPEVQCLGRVEGQSKRRYEATVSVAEIPTLGPKRRRLRGKTMPCWRVNASDDLAMVADLFGGDLREVIMPASGGSVPSTWLDYDACVAVLHEHGINAARIDALEVYAGCGNWTEACRILGLQVGLPIDNKNNKNRWNLLSAKWRRVLWAIVVVRRPRWIHSGFPCTFWVRLAHLTRKKSLQQNEAERLRELVHIVLTLQLASWQHRQGFMMSLENPPDAQSWKLDIMVQTLRDTQMNKVFFHSCAWGHRDPGSGKPYLKRQCIAAFASVDLSPLARRCVCPGGRMAGVHERIEGVTIVPGKGKVRRSVVSGEYPLTLCHAWGKIVKQHLRLP